VSGRTSRESRRRALQEARAAQRRRTRRLRLAGIGGGAVALAAAAVGISLVVASPTPGATQGMYQADPGSAGTGSTVTSASYAPLSTLGKLKPAPPPGSLGPENVPVPDAVPLAGLTGTATGQEIDGIQCGAMEQTLFHVHTHLTIFVDGQQRQIPAAIGIPGAQAEPTSAGPWVAAGTCFYWLHTHAADGIIHIESPVQRTYTLGEFFDEWGQPLGPDQVGPARGKVTVIVNGKVFLGNPRNVPLGSHENLQLDVGTPLVAPETINWSITGL
jgi:hypothetical protein